MGESTRSDRSSRSPVLAVGAAVLAAILLAAAFAILSGSPAAPSGVVVGTRPASVRGASVAAASLTAPAPAIAAVPTWINVTDSGPGGAPPQTFAASTAYDPADQATVVFGGCQNVLCPSNETWLFAQGRWINVTDPRDAPPARYDASMDYDPNMGGVLLFGGVGASGALNDTWLFAGDRWTDLSWIGPAPPARSSASLAFDPESEENGSVLFGGMLASGSVTNDTWVWEGWSGWLPLNASVYPAAVEFGNLAYDAHDHYLLLFGGAVPCGFLCLAPSNATWELYAGEWWPVHPGTVPAARFAAATTYDAALGAVVMFGGGNGLFSAINDTWSYAGGAWQSLSPALAPPPRSNAASSPDSGPLAPIVFGGVNGFTPLNDTWVFEARPNLGLSVAPASPEVSAPVTVTLTVSGGTSPYSALVDFGDGSLGAAQGAGPTLTLTHVYSVAGSYHVSANLTDEVGVAASATAPAITVVAGPSVQARASSPAVDAGILVHFTAIPTSLGTPPLSYAWRFGDGSGASGANASHAYGSPGLYTATVNATDAAGGTAAASVVVDVAALPTVSAATAPSAPAAGGAVLLFANVSGGTAPFSYAWEFGDGNGSGSPVPLHAFARPGTYTVNVWVNDSGGGSAHATVTVTVASVTASAGGEPGWFLPAFLVLVALGAVGVAAAVLLTRRRPPSA